MNQQRPRIFLLVVVALISISVLVQFLLWILLNGSKTSNNDNDNNIISGYRHWHPAVSEALVGNTTMLRASRTTKKKRATASKMDNDDVPSLLLDGWKPQALPLSAQEPPPECREYGCPVVPSEIDSAEIVRGLELQKKLLDNGGGGRDSGLNPTAVDETAFFRALGAGFDFVTATRQSNSHDYNQDRAFLVKPFVTTMTTSSNNTSTLRRQTQATKATKLNNCSSCSFLLGILDGHGRDGHVVARYAAEAIPRRLAEKFNSNSNNKSLSAAAAANDGDDFDDWIRKQLSDTFVEVDREAPPQALNGGCTASVTLRLGNKLYVANTGDSRTLLVRQYYYASREDAPQRQQTTTELGESEVVYQTVLHKPSVPAERARIEAAGGRVRVNPNFPADSRVIVYSSAAIPPEPIGLAMSRSIGDWEWGAAGVIPDPTVSVVDLSNLTDSQSDDSSSSSSLRSVLFLMAASDGVFDSGRRPQWFARRFGPNMVKIHLQQKGSTARAAKAKTSKAADSPLLKMSANVMREISPAKKEWYRDDMTFILIQTDPT